MIVEVKISSTFQFDSDEFFSEDEGLSEQDIIEECTFMALHALHDDANPDIDVTVVSR